MTAQRAAYLRRVIPRLTETYRRPGAVPEWARLVGIEMTAWQTVLVESLNAGPSPAWHGQSPPMVCSSCGADLTGGKYCQQCGWRNP